MQADDLVSHEQTEPRPLPDLFGREKRIENSRQYLARNSRAAVLDLQRSPQSFRKLFAPSPDGQIALAGQGIQRILDDVDQNLLEAQAIDVDDQLRIDVGRDFKPCSQVMASQ